MKSNRGRSMRLKLLQPLDDADAIKLLKCIWLHCWWILMIWWMNGVVQKFQEICLLVFFLFDNLESTCKILITRGKGQWSLVITARISYLMYLMAVGVNGGYRFARGKKSADCFFCQKMCENPFTSRARSPVGNGRSFCLKCCSTTSAISCSVARDETWWTGEPKFENKRANPCQTYWANQEWSMVKVILVDKG